MFGAMMGAKLHLVAKSLDPVTSDAGVTITPDATFDTCPHDLTVLFTPGGTDGTIKAATDPATLALMADRGSRAKYVTSVCSGSLILGAAGLLRGDKATSHWSCRDALAGFGAMPEGDSLGSWPRCFAPGMWIGAGCCRPHCTSSCRPGTWRTSSATRCGKRSTSRPTSTPTARSAATRPTIRG